FADHVVVAAMGLGTAMTTHQTRQKDLKGTAPIAKENAKNHAAVRGTLTGQGIFPEKLPPAGDIKSVQDRVERRRAKLTKRHREEVGAIPLYILGAGIATDVTEPSRGAAPRVFASP